jgi:hypothetical protein
VLHDRELTENQIEIHDQTAGKTKTIKTNQATVNHMVNQTMTSLVMRWNYD